MTIRKLAEKIAKDFQLSVKDRDWETKLSF